MAKICSDEIFSVKEAQKILAPLMKIIALKLDMER